MIRFFSPGLMILAVVAPTGAAPRPAGTEQTFYFPSTVGDRLLFENTRDGKTNEFTLEVVEVEKKGRVVEVTVTLGDDTPHDRPTLKYRLSDSGIDQLTVGKTMYSPPKPVFRLPVKPDEAWTWMRKSANGKETFRTVREEEVEVPAGKFKAIRVDHENDDGTYTDWYAPGLGSIKRESSSKFAGEGVRVLKSFTPAKK